MRFYLPAFEGSDDDLIKTWEELRQVMQEGGGYPATTRKIQSLFYRHNGKDWADIVGERSQRNHDLVCAIFECVGNDLFMVCTNIQGVHRGAPILVGASSVTDVVDFDPWPSYSQTV